MMQAASTGSRHVVLTGCSGGGKSTLLAELARRGLATVEEPGRRIVERALRGEDGALPWDDPVGFARCALALAAEDRRRMVEVDGWVFFDRGLIDAAVALEHAAGISASGTLARNERYHRTVFLAPPWPEIFATDEARRHGFSEAVAEYRRLRSACSEFGYEAVILPKAGVAERADFVLTRLG